MLLCPTLGTVMALSRVHPLTIALLPEVASNIDGTFPGKPEVSELRSGDQGGAEGAWSYEYVPGAGDDEESWARGLTPELLWQHQQACQHAPSPAVSHLCS